MAKLKTPAPTLRFLFSHPAHLIACGFGSGLSPIAPGTFGTLFAWLTFPLLALSFNLLGVLASEFLLAFLVFCVLGGMFAVHKTGQDLGVIDHGSIVWDEIAPFWLVLYFCPLGFYWQLGAFVLFRLFDISKPQPARYFDQHVKNGFGVMADDLVAGAYTLLALTGFYYFIGQSF